MLTLQVLPVVLENVPQINTQTTIPKIKCTQTLPVNFKDGMKNRHEVACLNQ